MNRPTTIKLLSFFILGIIFLTGCGNSFAGNNESNSAPNGETATLPITSDFSSTDEIDPTPDAPTEKPEDSTLVICIPEEPETLHPLTATSSAANLILQTIYDGPFDLVSYNLEPVILQRVPSLADGDAVISTVLVGEGDLIQRDNGEVVELAPGMKVRPSDCIDNSCAIDYLGGDLIMDQMIVTFKLLRGMLWSDGTPLTANDSVYSYLLARDPATATSKYLVDRTAEYSAKDEITVEWRGVPGFIDPNQPNYALNFFTPYPLHEWGTLTPVELVNAPVTNEKPMGWGPYMIESWTRGENIVMKKNPYYFRSPEGLPYFSELIIRFIGNDINTNIATTITGECDMFSGFPTNETPIELLKELEQNEQIKAVYSHTTTWEHINFGIHPAAYDDGINRSDREPIFEDVRTRQAIAYCFDRERVVNLLYAGNTTVMDTYLPPEHPLFNSTTMKYPFDPVQGIALLEEVGWVTGDDGYREADGVDGVRNGTRLSMNYYAVEGERNANTFLILAGAAAQCGIEVIPTYFPTEEFYADGPEGIFWGRNFDLAQSTWVATLHPRCDNWLTDRIPGDETLTAGSVDWLSATLDFESDLSVPAFPLGWEGWNVSGYSNSIYNIACNSALGSLSGQKAYQEGHQAAQQLFAEELPILPLFPRIKVTVTRPDMCGFSLDPTAGVLYKIEEIGFGEYCR